ncbi:MAG: DMT family transporter [Bacteroidales bacterium]|nr:DMT family transporter [Bacteroidales bacterium]MBR4454228.1 DMT family transporter [Bacteroidales bacterium]
MKNHKLLGTLAGIAAAICYGTNPLGALKLYAAGMQTNSVLFYRFGLAWVIITIVMLLRKESFRVTRQEFRVLTGLGLLFIVSSLTLYLSFLYMAAGVASTILFTYPVMTAVIMALFFHERITFSTVLSLLLSGAGVVMLYWSDGVGTLSILGVFLVLASALSYALYIILMNKGNLQMSSFKINFYVLMYCTLGMVVYSLLAGMPLTLPQNAVSWFYVGWLAIVPAIFALVLMVYAAKYVGSTATAILGALEPLTAVLIGLLVFNEPFTTYLAVGIVLILAAVVIIAMVKQNKPTT